MTQHDHKLFSTPVSVNDGFKRSDSKSWTILGIALLVAVAIVAVINLVFEKPKVKWPSSPAQPAAQPAEPPPDEPRTYDVAPPARVPPPG